MNLRVTFGKFTAATTGNKIQEQPKKEERKEESQENLSFNREPENPNGERIWNA